MSAPNSRTGTNAVVPHARPNPVVRADDAAQYMQPKSHWLNTDARRAAVCLSDMAGLGNDVAVHRVSVAAGDETTEMHHHLYDSEWLYILSGTATLHLTECPMAGAVPCPPDAERESRDVAVAQGDFIGFKGLLQWGSGEAAWAHTMVAGEGGVEYLVGGTRKDVDVCVYPVKGKSLFIHRTGERSVVDSAALKDPGPQTQPLKASEPPKDAGDK